MFYCKISSVFGLVGLTLIWFQIFVWGATMSQPSELELTFHLTSKLIYFNIGKTCKQEILLKNIYCFVLSANLFYASFYFSNSVAKRHFATFFSDVAIVSKANAYIKHEQYLVLKNVRLISEKLKLWPKNYSNFILVKAAKSCRNHIFLMKFLITGLT